MQRPVRHFCDFRCSKQSRNPHTCVNVYDALRSPAPVRGLSTVPAGVSVAPCDTMSVSRYSIICLYCTTPHCIALHYTVLCRTVMSWNAIQCNDIHPYTHPCIHPSVHTYVHTYRFVQCACEQRTHADGHSVEASVAGGTCTSVTSSAGSEAARTSILCCAIVARMQIRVRTRCYDMI